METLIQPNSASLLQKEVKWMKEIIATALALHFKNESRYASIEALAPPKIVAEASGYAQLLTKHDLSHEERILLMLALLPHVKPQALDVLLTKNKDLDQGFSEFGGVQEAPHRGFIPTLETASFILGGAGTYTHVSSPGAAKIRVGTHVKGTAAAGRKLPETQRVRQNEAHIDEISSKLPCFVVWSMGLSRSVAR